MTYSEIILRRMMRFIRWRRSGRKPPPFEPIAIGENETLGEATQLHDNELRGGFHLDIHGERSEMSFDDVLDVSIPEPSRSTTVSEISGQIVDASKDEVKDDDDAYPKIREVDVENTYATSIAAFITEKGGQIDVNEIKDEHVILDLVQGLGDGANILEELAVFIERRYMNHIISSVEVIDLDGTISDGKRALVLLMT